MSQPTVNDMLAYAADAGASGAFIRTLATDSPTAKHYLRGCVRTAMERGNDMPNMGGFGRSLWDGEPRFDGSNPYGADGSNSKLLAAAGVAGYGCECESGCERCYYK